MVNTNERLDPFPSNAGFGSSSTVGERHHPWVSISPSSFVACYWIKPNLRLDEIDLAIVVAWC